MPDSAPMAILVLEDNDGDAQLLQARVEPFANLRLTFASTLREALEAAKGASFDVALLDLDVPDSEGIGTFETFHAAFPSVPVVILSGQRVNATAREAIRLGAMDFLPKQALNADALLRTLRFAIERAKHHAELRAHKSYLDAVGQAVIVLDKQGLVRYWNQAATRLYGWTPEETVGRSIREFSVSDFDEKTSREIIQQALAGNTWAGEFIARRRDGSTFPAFVVDTPIRDGGATVGLIGVSHDLTESKRTEEQLREAVFRARTAQKIAHISAWRVHLETGTAEWDNEVYERRGLDPATTVLSFDAAFDAIVEEDRARMRAWFDEIRHDPAPRETEMRVAPLKGGEPVVLQIVAHPILGSDGGVVGIHGITRDITLERRREEEMERLRRSEAERERLSALGTLVAGVAHEINNPLSYMQCATELALTTLEEATPQDEASWREAHQTIREHLDQVLRGVEGIARITKALKEISRAPNGIRKRENVASLVQSVLAVAESRLPSQVRIEQDLDADLAAIVNSGELSQVLLNLFINAGEAIGPREGTVRIRAKATSRGLDIAVEDSGPGIPPSVASKIFTPFYTTKAAGTGLGLSLSRKIVEDHGGTLTFDTRPGMGTTFHVRLPAAT